MNVESSVIPLLASPPRSASAIARSLKKRRGGRAIKKISRSLRCSRGRGGFPMENKKENHPVCAEQGGFATSYLTAQPPLLAVMQGGEHAQPAIRSQVLKACAYLEGESEPTYAGIAMMFFIATFSLVR